MSVRDSVTETVTEAVTALRERGYAVLPGIHPPEDVAFFKRALGELYEELGIDGARADAHYEPAENVEVGPAGVVFHRLTRHVPEAIPHLLRPEAVAVLRGLLGEDMRLELPAGVVSDHTRPFFDWHTHLGGVDDQRAGYAREFRTFTRSERATMIHYLDGLDASSGPLLVLPRRIDEPTEPPHPVTQHDWPGQVEVTCPPGSVVILEQATWHAARQRTAEGLRMFVGFYFASADAPPTPIADPDLADYDGPDALFRSVVTGSTGA